MGAANKIFQTNLNNAWFSQFVRRHEEQLSCRRKEAMPKLCRCAEYFEEIQLWIEKVEKFHSEKHFPSHAIVNADETRLYEKSGNFYLERIGRRGGKSSRTISSNEYSLGTLIPFVLGNGNVICSIFIFKAFFNAQNETTGSFYLPTYCRETRQQWCRYFIFTETSYVNNEVWEVIMKIFIDEWTTKYPGLHCCLYLDYCKVHGQPHVILNAVKAGVYTILLLEKSTDWLQPLDQTPFAVLKYNIIHFLEDDKLAASLHSAYLSERHMGAVFKAERKAFQPHILRDGWKITGLYLLEKNAILKHDKEVLGELDDIESAEFKATLLAKRVIEDNIPSKVTKKVVGLVKLHKPYLVSDVEIMLKNKERERIEKEKEQKLKVEKKALNESNRMI